jgi:RNA polymerase sigma factor (sigma-70 family)
VVQMVLLKLTTRMRDFEYDPNRSFRGWLRTICRNAWSDLMASRKNQAGSGDSRVDSLLNSLPARDALIQQLEEVYDLELSTEAMQRVRLRVQPRTWEAFQLTAIEGLSGAEAAARLGIKITLVYKAKSSIQKLLQEEIRYLEGPNTHE